jgi:hypothetical protein
VLDDAEAVLQLASKYVFGSTGEASQRFTYYPNFTDSTAYRAKRADRTGVHDVEGC